MTESYEATARIDDDADLVVKAADALQQLRSAQVGKAVIDHRHAEVALLGMLQGFAGGTAADDVKPLLFENAQSSLNSAALSSTTSTWEKRSVGTGGGPQCLLRTA